MNSGIDSRQTSSSEACIGTMITGGGANSISSSAAPPPPSSSATTTLDTGPVCHQCSACTFASEDLKIFSRHLKRDHRPLDRSDSDSDSTRRSLFPCDQGCTFETDRFDAYRAHFTAHSRFHRDPRHPAILRYYQCPLCPYVSSVMMSADAHMDEAHIDECSNFTVQRVKLAVDVPTLPVSVSSPLGRICTGRTGASAAVPTAAVPGAVPSSALPVVPSPPPLIHHGVRPPPPVYPSQVRSHSDQLAPPSHPTPPSQQRNPSASSASYRSPLEQMQDMQRYQQHQQQHHRAMVYPNQTNGYGQPRHMSQPPQHLSQQQQHHHHQQQLNQQMMDNGSNLSYPPSEQHLQQQMRRRQPPPPGAPYNTRYQTPQTDQHLQMESQRMRSDNNMYNNPRVNPMEQHRQHHLPVEHRLRMDQCDDPMGEDEKEGDIVDQEDLQSLGQIEMTPYIKDEPLDYDNAYGGEMLEEPLRRLQDLEPLQTPCSNNNNNNGTISKTTCPICGHIFSSSGNMKRHMRRRHGHKPAAVYKNRRPSLPAQSPRGHPNGRFLSNLPTIRKRNPSSSNSGSSGMLLNCPQCPFRCTTTALLDKHQINHAKMDRIADGFRCAYCTARARYPVYMRRHLATYHRDQPPLASQVLNNTVSSTFRDMSDPGITNQNETKSSAKKDRGLDKLLSEFIGFLPTQDTFDEPTKCCNCDYETTDRAEIVNHITIEHMSKVIFYVL